ncbi:hypothetical protein TNCV_225111 [Trichonephila clavipes]|nr:hypothetical protein TNCV_225111 [Trichonephila clavipes]
MWILLEVQGDCDGPVVKLSHYGRHDMSSSPVPLKTRRGAGKVKKDSACIQTILEIPKTEESPEGPRPFRNPNKSRCGQER